ncbi:hypothetical protein L9G16_08420 [Shewanella sp. A25]|nr:hypothetical protein [Shewanella shenzhenensis]
MSQNKKLEHLTLQYEQAIEEICLYSKLVNELKSEIKKLKTTLTNSHTTVATYSSNHFDESIYINKYPDVIKSGLTPKEHFDKLGKLLGRNCIKNN